MRTRAATRLAILGVVGAMGLGACSDDFVVTPIYNHANARVQIQLSRDLESGESVYVQVRRGKFGVLDCSKLAQDVSAIDGASGTRIDGPLVDAALTQPFYGEEWAHGNPTPAMLAQLEKGTDSIIDVCIMNGSEVVTQIERDLFQAWDQGRKQGLGGKADDPSGEVRINSAQEYGVRCVAELGEIPFFEKLGDQDYGTYNCLDSTPIPMTVTDANGVIDAPQAGTVAKCDNPQYIYDLCEAGPRVASRTNEMGTRWVLLCRKSKKDANGNEGYASSEFNDIAMVGTNPFTGKTCFFQNALYQKTDGAKVPHPADKTKSTNLWSGVQGGVGTINCQKCHNTDALIHTPWIDGAVDGAGRPIIPKMGIDPDMPLGALDTPYVLVNAKGQGWKPSEHITSPEVGACTKCHRMGKDRWSEDWLDRLEGSDTAWTNITTAKGNEAHHKYWMPTDVTFSSDAEWSSSAFQTAIDFIQNCSKNPTATGCRWEEVPQTLGEGGGNGLLYTAVNLADNELAKQATTLLGMNKNALSNNCTECHAGNRATLDDWHEKTQEALSTCFAAGGGSGSPREDKQNDLSLGAGDWKTFGPYEVAAGKTIEVEMTGSGDADLYVKRGAEATEEVYDCRPYGNDSNESCNPETFNATGPAKFWVGVKGFSASKVDITATWTAPGEGGNTRPAKEIVDCLKLEPGRSDSPYSPGKAGIFAAAAHLGYFQAQFKNAFPAGTDGNTADSWALQYGSFKNRVSMPKGNHPRFSQEQIDILATWFERGMPRADEYLPADTGPTSCTPSITSAVATHVSQMSTQGWAAANRAAGLAMYGCGSETNPQRCLTSKPDAESKSYGAGWTHAGKLRVLSELDFNTFFWMRSSPDGRFVANGATGGDGAVITDLQTGKNINVDAAYDPGFFPDNRGWVFMGTPIGAGFCGMGLLTSNPDKIDFSESGCGTVGNVGLYQHLAAGLNGGDYFAINSQFTSDNPSGSVNEDPSANFGASAQLKITPMVYSGTEYTGKPSATTNSPYEGDSVLSPSSKLVISRFGNGDGHLGYVLRRVNATPNGASYDVTTTEIARYCVNGAKPSISFDEKYFVTHHYVTANDYADLGYSSASDPAFQKILEEGSANIIVVNMQTGVRTRVTTMKAGQYALFPHFRSDGWIYFQVRDHNTDKEYVLGSDAVMGL